MELVTNGRAATVTPKIVERTGAPPPPLAARPGFLARVPGTTLFRFDVKPGTDDVATHLTRRVAADPTDARVHVSRVNHHIARKEADLAFGALVDAFYALGARAGGLRARLLAGARDLIGPARAALLEAAVDTGLSPSSRMASCPGSILCRGITGATDIVAAVELR